jgi:Zn-dependent peptidase ImmA (M78 family)
MTKKSTLETGDAFEEKVFRIIQDLLVNNEFFVPGHYSKIFRKKGYYSESRKSNIIVDISIETYLGNADKCSIITVLECKSYGKKGVPVDDIEEFDSKLNQIGEHNTKGIIVTNSTFQRSSISLAISKKIALVHISDSGEIDWINYRKDEKASTPISSNIESISSDCLKLNFFGFSGNKRYYTLPDLLISLGVIDFYNNQPKYIRIPFRSESKIVREIEEFSSSEFYSNDRLDTEMLCNYFTKIYNVSFNFDEELAYDRSNKVLGKISLNPLRIYITKDLNLDPHRWRFTLAHEIGHLVLHRGEITSYLDEYTDNELTISMHGFDLSPKYNKRLEIQANIFASRLLIPQYQLIKHVKDYFVRENIHKNYLYLDSQRCNIDLTYRLLYELQEHFNVSKEVVRIRLISQGLLRDTLDDLSIKNILRAL